MPCDEVLNVARGVLVELLVLTKDDDCYVDLTQYRQFMSLFEETALALDKGAVG